MNKQTIITVLLESLVRRNIKGLIIIAGSSPNGIRTQNTFPKIS
jgi:hypothetical protein